MQTGQLVRRLLEISLPLYFAWEMLQMPAFIGALFCAPARLGAVCSLILESGTVPTRSLIALGVVGILLTLVTWAVVFLVWRHRYTSLGVAVIAALLALTAWVIVIWPAYWD